MAPKMDQVGLFLHFWAENMKPLPFIINKLPQWRWLGVAHRSHEISQLNIHSGQYLVLLGMAT